MEPTNQEMSFGRTVPEANEIRTECDVQQKHQPTIRVPRFIPQNACTGSISDVQQNSYLGICFVLPNLHDLLASKSSIAQYQVHDEDSPIL
jgi:hypothetical protein